MRDYLQGILDAYAVFGMNDEAYDKIGSRLISLLLKTPIKIILYTLSGNKVSWKSYDIFISNKLGILFIYPYESHDRPFVKNSIRESQKRNRKEELTLR